jgi:hypothetical protein
VYTVTVPEQFAAVEQLQLGHAVVTAEPTSCRTLRGPAGHAIAPDARMHALNGSAMVGEHTLPLQFAACGVSAGQARSAPVDVAAPEATPGAVQTPPVAGGDV